MEMSTPTLRSYDRVLLGPTLYEDGVFGIYTQAYSLLVYILCSVEWCVGQFCWKRFFCKYSAVCDVTVWATALLAAASF